MYPPLYLMRHGQTHWNAEKRIQGQMESELNDLGRQHAARQGEILTTLDLPDGLGVYCSPLKRTRQTAEIALAPAGLHPTFDDRLKEISMGEWEGFLYAEMAERHPDFFASRATFDVILDGPGENHDDMTARIASFLDSLSGPALVISHGVALSYVRALVRGLDRDAMRDMKREQGVVIELRDGVEVVHR